MRKSGLTVSLSLSVFIHQMKGWSSSVSPSVTAVGRAVGAPWQENTVVGGRGGLH